MKLKYILTRTGAFALFSEVHTHADMARGMYGDIVSAGFCHLSVAYNDGNPEIKYRMNCYGESISLKLKSRPEDSDIISNKLNNPY